MIYSKGFAYEAEPCTFREVPMPRHLLAALSLVLVAATAVPVAADTFSIVAVDPYTGQVGSAGASCISGSIIISDIHPDVGVIHTQSYWNSQNQNYARSLMDQGYSPEAIIDSLVANDAQNNPSIRQYGIVDLVDGGRSAAFTGENCLDYKNHLLGPTYAIQGNILLGPEVLELMETGFLTTVGSLADKLMAALQGANFPGADRRCLEDGKSSISAFIRVANPEDEPGAYHLDLNVNNTGPGVEPIDVLQGLYDEWRLEATDVASDGGDLHHRLTLLPNRPNPIGESTTFVFALPRPTRAILDLFDLEGRRIARVLDDRLPSGMHQVDWTVDARLDPGVYTVRLRTEQRAVSRKVVLLRDPN
ncbi:MAG: DUF1028 domain-containing protein [Candidatus Eisenbacteria bacterium]|nr:DUF1028 domain-containing protein [Candidatus Latescibacterota bacterium]MBD3301393.1 DUF1028 domain-containing protein [Candidatus Eisenbacteria bacterium]